MSRLKVLVADDNPNVCEIIRLYFEQNQMDVLEARNGLEALQLARTELPDFIILDIMMPEMDGLEVCRQIRKDFNIPIIMLTAKDEELDRVLGLEIGADDYVTKPFSPRELVARIKAILRRIRSDQMQNDLPMERQIIQIDPITVHMRNREVSVHGQSLFFRPKEFDLLVYMMKHAGAVLTRDQLLRHVWGYDFVGDIRTVDVHVKKIREHLAPFDFECIHTVWGVGYRFDVVPTNRGDGLS